MKHLIKILHLEDNPLDAEIIRDRIEADGLACEIILVNGKSAFESALDQGAFDLILCDFNLPDYDGLSALAQARERQPSTPVIMISGVLDEEEAVKCLHLGAADYLLKQRIERLPSAVKRALEEVEEHRKRKQTEAALRDSEAILRSFFDSAGGMRGIVEIVDDDVLHISDNAVAAVFHGQTKDSMHHKRDSELGVPEPIRRLWMDRLRESRRADAPVCFDYSRQTSCGDQWLFVTVSHVGSAPNGNPRFAYLVQDITERRQIERHALHTQRLESIGTLASGVAHDLNNALAPIMMGAELLKMQYPQESRILDMFEASARRCADMVRQLLTFAKGAEGERVLIQPSHLVKELKQLMEGSFPKNIQLVVECAPNLPTVLGDATQLHQILMNLCVNARDAMPNGGTLTLGAENVEIDDTYASAVPDAKPGKYLALRVRDTGTGIPPEILDRIFDPFFTTKGPDKGTGLGLSTVMSIVKAHSGFLRVSSQPGQGSTFTAYLPAGGAKGGDTGLSAKAAMELLGQGETILLVDDEAALRAVASAVLQGMNFKVLTATDGADGLIQAALHRAELRAIITDLHMPHMDGMAFVRALRRMLPDIPIMVASGRMEDALAGEFKALGVTIRLDKPFTKVQLAEALKNLLAPK